MSKVQEALIKLFNIHRIIIWYDEKRELTEQFDELDFGEDAEKLRVAGNEFEVKYIINKQRPDHKFLVYLDGQRPANHENWLLDVELAHHVFRTDQEAMFLQEMGLPYDYKDLVSEHIEFFKSKERRTKLKELLGEGDEFEEIRGKMLAVLFNTEYVNLITFIHAHGAAFVNGSDQFDKDLERYNLSAYYWGKIAGQFNYHNESPSIYDFLLEVFNANTQAGSGSSLSKESRLILSLWKDTVQYQESFGQISNKVEQDLKIEGWLSDAPIDLIINDDLFRTTDLRVLHELVNLVVEEQMSHDKLVDHVKSRENKFWYRDTESFYRAIEFGSEMISLVRKHAGKQYSSFDEGVKDYANTLFTIDQAYRKFIFYQRQTSQNRILTTLATKVEKVYSNDWLLRYNNNWQTVIDKLDVWPTGERYNQQQFFKQHVEPFISKGNRLFVIISDALRFECGEELRRRLLSENRYESSTEFMVSSLPSYTQLGMASLLPHKKIEFAENSDAIILDGISATGTPNRAKILATNSGVRATAIQAEEFMKMNSATEGREFVKEYDLVYIYHNRIDKTGDDKTSEERVFDDVERELDFLLDLLKKIANTNGNHMMITADHGFIYQHQPLEESDFSASSHEGDLWKESRRYALGRNLIGDDSTKKFSASQLNIQSDAEVLIPKSINRLRIKGSGSRFIHGGAAMQEIVVPLVKVSKKRKDTTNQVDIDIIKSTDRITTNILAVSFIQQTLVTDQMLPRTIKAYIESEDGTILSDQFQYNFDITQGTERQREVKNRFQLAAKASGKYKNQRVKLVLMEPIEGTQKWKEYKTYAYTLNISFTNDFDDF